MRNYLQLYTAFVTAFTRSKRVFGAYGEDSVDAVGSRDFSVSGFMPKRREGLHNSGGAINFCSISVKLRKTFILFTATRGCFALLQNASSLLQLSTFS